MKVFIYERTNDVVINATLKELEIIQRAILLLDWSFPDIKLDEAKERAKESIKMALRNIELK